MIDIDRIDEQLALAVSEVRVPVRRTPAPVPAPTPAPAPAVAPKRAAARPAPRPSVPTPAMAVPELLELGLLAEADAAIGRTSDRRDAVTWATMRALLAGRKDDVAAGIADLRTLDEGRAWVQRFWAAAEWGTEEERYEVLDHCRTRAYRFDDLEWWGNLTLLLAGMGKQDEAVRAFDEASELLAGHTQDALWLDALTNLIEAAAVAGDWGRVAAAGRSLRGPDDRLVVVGPAVVCKGSVLRYRALVHVATGQWGKAQDCFAAAEAVHRAIGAAPLLRRTQQQASGLLAAA